jgi:hypothetical protein
MRRLPLLALLVALACNAQQVTSFDGVSEEEIRGLFYFHHATNESTAPGPSGHGFLLSRPNAPPLGLTAYHVAGPIGGSPANPAVPRVLGVLRRPVNALLSLRLGERVPVTGAQTIGSGESQRDLAVFNVLDVDNTQTFPLASQLPNVGDTVYVLAVHVGDHPRSGPRKHPARVSVSSATALNYVYLASANSNMTSGAAVLNREGSVVGVNVGSLVNNGQVTGLAVHALSIAALLPK